MIRHIQNFRFRGRERLGHGLLGFVRSGTLPGNDALLGATFRGKGFLTGLLLGGILGANGTTPCLVSLLDKNESGGFGF
jgi:hypothetical protein